MRCTRLTEFIGNCVEGQNCSVRLQCHFLTGSTSRSSFSGSSPWELEAMCYLFLHSFTLSVHSLLWYMVEGANWLTWCKECLRDNKLYGYADDSTLVAVVPSPV